MKIILLGLSSSGKTTTAKYLEKYGNYKMIDIDAKIEKKIHMTVREFYSKYGRKTFRKMELDVLQECIFSKEEQCGDANIIISTGGGLIENTDAILFLNSLKKRELNNVKIFFLNSSLKTLWARISKKIQKEMYIPAFLEDGLKNTSPFRKYDVLQIKSMQSLFSLNEHARNKILKATKMYFKLIYKKRMERLPLLDCIKIKVKNKKANKVATYIKKIVLKKL